MASLFHDKPELAANLLMDKPAQLSEVDTYKLNLILRVYPNQGPKLFKLYTAGIFPEADWSLGAAGIKQVVKQTHFSRGFIKNNLIFSEMHSHLNTRAVVRASEFE